MRLLPITCALSAALLWMGEAAAQDIALKQMSHIHGLAADPGNASRLFVATHHGLYLAGPGPVARRISRTADDLMGFQAHPSAPGVFFASGHPVGGGNLGFVISADGGISWQQISPGVNGPVDFHAMSVSPSNPQVIYGTHGGLQVSRNGGYRWSMVGALPPRTIDLAVSAADSDFIFAASEGGLMASRDGGRTWIQDHPERRPFTLVETVNGQTYTFMYGAGLLRRSGENWQLVAPAPSPDTFFLHLAGNATLLYAATQKNEILESADSGATWRPFGE